jgi:hypothetical protein
LEPSEGQIKSVEVYFGEKLGLRGGKLGLSGNNWGINGRLLVDQLGSIDAKWQQMTHWVGLFRAKWGWWEFQHFTIAYKFWNLHFI